MVQQDDFEFEPEFSDYADFDPLSEDDAAEEIRAVASEFAAQQAEAATPEATPEERIESLFTRMGMQSRTLLALLAFCETPQLSSAVADKVEELKRFRTSVYTATDYCAMLEEAGALQRTLEDGTLWGSIRQEPERIVQDGTEYLKPRPMPPLHWMSTEAGMARVVADNPFERVRLMLAEEGQERYLPVYKAILNLCGGEGVALSKLTDALNKHPLLQNPHLYVQFFIERLEQTGGLEWRNAWVTTADGSRILDEILADVEDATATAPKED